MKHQALNIVLSIIIIVLAIKLANTKSDIGNIKEELLSANQKIEINSTLKTIFNCTRVRKYTNREVTKKTLTLLTKAGMSASSLVNKQPWAFIAINDTTILLELAKKLPHAGMLKKAKAAIVVCGNLDKTLRGKGKEFWIQDCSAASQNILIAAKSKGLGSAWTDIYPNEKSIKSVKKVLNLTDNYIPLNIIVIGYPKKIRIPKNRWKEENLLWNRQK